MNAGQKALEWLYTDQLKVDAEWSVRTPTGFTWWPHRHAQHVEVLREVRGPAGDQGYVVRIRTEILRLSSLQQGAQMLDLLMATPSMSGVVHDEASGILYLSAAVLVHEGIREWMSRMLSVAAMLQATDAHFMADVLAPAFGAQSAASPHPKNGSRAKPDELVAAFPSMCNSLGKQKPRWTEAEFDAALRQHMQQPPAVMATGGGLGVTIEFPYGRRTSLCQMKADEPHPRLGNGLLLVQSFPVEHLELSDDAFRTLALQENRRELSEDPKGYGFGSFCYRDGCLHFNSFFPNLIYMPGLLPNFYFQCAARAGHMAEELAEPVAGRPTSALHHVLARVQAKAATPIDIVAPRISVPGSPRDILTEDFPSIGPLPIRGGWGYSKEDAVIIDGGRSEGLGIEKVFVEKRIYEELIVCRDMRERYSGISWNIMLQSLQNHGGRPFDVLRVEVTALPDKDWQELKAEWDGPNGSASPDFDVEAHRNKRQSRTVRYETDYWFDITSFFGKR